MRSGGPWVQSRNPPNASADLDPSAGPRVREDLRTPTLCDGQTAAESYRQEQRRGARRLILVDAVTAAREGPGPDSAGGLVLPGPRGDPFTGRGYVELVYLIGGAVMLQCAGRRPLRAGRDPGELALATRGDNPCGSPD